MRRDYCYPRNANFYGSVWHQISVGVDQDAHECRHRNEAERHWQQGGEQQRLHAVEFLAYQNAYFATLPSSAKAYFIY